MSRLDDEAAVSKGGALPPGHRRRQVVVGLVVVGLLVLSAAWAVAAVRLVRSQESRQSYETQVLSDTRYYDELLTMSAMMAAQTGADVWVQRYRRGEANLAESLRIALDNVPDDQVAALLATDAANQALVAIEHEALAAVESGDLAKAQALLASARYSELKERYAASTAEATRLYEELSQSETRGWTWLLGGQFVITAVGLLLIGLLGLWLVRALRVAAAAQVAQREAELKASQELFRRAMQESTVAMALVSPSGLLEDVNPALCAFLGRDADTLTSMTWRDLTLPEDLPDADQALAAVRDGSRDHYRATRHYRHADGSALVADISVSGIHDSSGELEYLLAQLVDVTERTRMTRQLAESERRFRLLAELATDVVLTIDAGGCLTWVSPSVLEVLGWDPDTLLGRPVQDLVHPADAPDLLARFTGAAGPDRITELRARCAAADGRWRWMGVSGRIVQDEEGHGVGARVALRDVTAEVESRQALQASEQRFRLLAENATDLIYQTDLQGTVTWVAPTVTRTLGWQPEELLGRSAADLLHLDDLEPGSRPIAQVARTSDGGPDAAASLVLTMTRTGDFRWMSVRITTLRDDAGVPQGRVVAMEDVDDLVRSREQAEREHLEAEEARREERRTRVSMDSAPIGMAITGLDGRFARVNPALCSMLGYRADELEGRAFADITHPDDADAGITAMADLIAGRIESFSQRKRYLTRDGTPIWIDLTVAVARDPDGHVQHFVAQVVDVNAEVTTFDALQRSMQQYRMLAENASDVVYQTDAQGILRWISPSMSVLLGWDPELLLGTRATALIAPEDLPAVNRWRAEVYAGRSLHGVVARFRAVDGAYRHMSVNAHPLTDTVGAVTGAVVALRDVTAEVAASRELDRRARIDTLTGLLNRGEILQRLQENLNDRRTPAMPVAVAFIDIDRLKTVNDTHGHAAGDLLITTVADRIRSCTRTGDYAGRIGGDELLVVLAAITDLEDAVSVAEKIRAAVSRPMSLGSNAITPTISIGVTLAEPGSDVDDAIARADHAVYQAKSHGRDTVVVA